MAQKNAAKLKTYVDCVNIPTISTGINIDICSLINDE